MSPLSSIGPGYSMIYSQSANGEHEKKKQKLIGKGKSKDLDVIPFLRKTDNSTFLNIFTIIKIFSSL